MGYLWEAVVVLLIGVEDHQEGGVDLWEEVVDLQAEADPRVEVDPQVAKNLQEQVEAKANSSWRHRCAFQCSLAKFPLEPMVPTMVSNTNTHYPCGSFIKESIVIPNLLC
jgi:hypothetical protein